MLGGRVQEPLLIHADRGDAFEPIRIRDRRVGELGHRPVRGVPTHTELRCGRRDRHPLNVDHRRQPATSPAGDRHALANLVDLFGPCVHRTDRLRATPPTPREHQHRRPTRDRQIPHHRPHPAMTHRSSSTRAAANEVDGGLRVQPPPAVDQLLDTDNEPGHTNERYRTLTTFDHDQGSLLVLRTPDTCTMARPLATHVDPNHRTRIFTPPHTSSRRARLT